MTAAEEEMSEATQPHEEGDATSQTQEDLSLTLGTQDVPDEDGNDHDEDDDDEEEDDDEDDDSAPLILGGTIDVPAFALLAGRFEDPKVGTVTPVSVPLTRLPATLGRNHKSESKSFFGLGGAKALSRNHFAIFYRDGLGGRLGQYNEENDALEYRPHAEVKKEGGSADSGGNDGEKVIRPNANEDDNNDDDDGAKLPQSGFFAIECLGKNKIIVGGTRIEQGQIAMLEHGTTVKCASYSLYFLLPTETTSGEPATVMKVPNPEYAAYRRKRAREQAMAAAAGDSDNDGTSSSKKKKAKTVASQSSKKETSMAAKKEGGHGLAKALAELEELPTSTLLERCTAAIETNTWERKHQMIGSAIAVHAVRDAARCSKLRAINREHGGVARGEVLGWIKNSALYGNWTTQILKKLEVRSYESNISKAIIRAGYTRTGTTGRHVRWALPEGLSSAEEDDEDDEEEDDNDDESDGGAEGADGSKKGAVSDDNSDRNDEDNGASNDSNDDTSN